MGNRPPDEQNRGGRQMQIERIGTVRAALGECPVWDAARNTLWMLDCRSGQLMQVDPDTGATQDWQLPAPVGSFAFNGDDDIIVALKDTFALYRLSDGAMRSLGHIGDSHPHLRLNDGAPLPDGSFVAGTMHIHRQAGQPPLGGLYRVDLQGKVSRIAQGLGVVNGPPCIPTACTSMFATVRSARSSAIAWMRKGSCHPLKFSWTRTRWGPRLTAAALIRRAACGRRWCMPRPLRGLMRTASSTAASNCRWRTLRHCVSAGRAYRTFS